MRPAGDAELLSHRLPPLVFLGRKIGAVRSRARGSSALIAVLVLIAIAGTGCAGLGVQPWERDILARRSMQIEPSPVESGMDDHLYFSKEASSGGRGFGGGGCGCN